MKQKWKVEMQFSYGWDDADWGEDTDEGRVPTRFDTKKEAEAEIRTFVREATADGLLGYYQKDYRAVRVEEGA